MAEVTLGSLRDALIFRADLPTSEPRRYSNDQLDMLINASIRRLQGFLVTWWGDDYFLAPADYTVGRPGELPGGQAVLGSDVKIKTVIWLPTGAPDRDRNVKLARVDMGRLHRVLENNDPGPLGDGRRWTPADPPLWWVEVAPTNNAHWLRFSYAPDRDETVRVYYAREFEALEFDADSIYLEWGWDDWVVLDAMIRIRQRDKQEYADIFSEREQLGARIAQQAPEKGQTEVVTVRDVYPVGPVATDGYWPRGDW